MLKQLIESRLYESYLSQIPDNKLALPVGITPRLLDRQAAAEYVGLGATTFDGEVQAGTLPGPVQFACRRRLWDRAALDKRLDEISGLDASAQSSAWIERLRNETQTTVRRRDP